jgi:hypothetical protein
VQSSVTSKQGFFLFFFFSDSKRTRRHRTSILSQSISIQSYLQCKNRGTFTQSMWATIKLHTTFNTWATVDQAAWSQLYQYNTQLKATCETKLGRNGNVQCSV